MKKFAAYGGLAAYEKAKESVNKFGPEMDYENRQGHRGKRRKTLLVECEETVESDQPTEES